MGTCSGVEEAFGLVLPCSRFITAGAGNTRAVVAADYALLPDILNSYDDVIYSGRSDVGHPVFRYVKAIDGETYVAAFEVRKKRRMMALQSLLD
jgi:hypothetical protein